MQDNKAAPSAPPLGFVVLHLVRISYVFASFPEPVLAHSNFQHAAFLGNANFEQKKVEKSMERALFTKET